MTGPLFSSIGMPRRPTEGLLDAHDDKTASVENGQGDPKRLEAGTRPLRGQGEMGSGDDEQRNTEENQAWHNSPDA